jgi:hypothetical protein
METNISDKYYRYKTTYSRSRESYSLLRNNPLFEVLVSHNVNLPDINITIDNHDKKYFKRPTSSKYEKVSEIDKDSFYNYFNISLDVIKGATWNNAEYYLIKYTDSFHLIAFSEDPRIKIDINISNDLDFTELKVGFYSSFSYRPSIRKRGIPITEEVFCFVFKESIKFIEDDCSYVLNRKEFWDRISKAIKEEILPVTSNNSRTNFDQLLDQLETKKKQIEQHLIERDTDTAQERASLRGEKDGINYAIKAIKSFFKLQDID